MGRAGFNRKTAYATLTMVLAAEAADCDILWLLKGPVEALQHHRGITHSFVGVPFMAAAVLVFVYLWHRFWRGRRKLRPSLPPPRWGYLYGLAIIAVLSHLLLDYTTAYGIRLFEPFDWRWYSWDIMFIVDPIMLGVLALGLVLPALFGLVDQDIGARSKGPRGRVGAIFALTCVVVLWGLRDYEHRRALNAMNSVTYNGASAERIAAYPYVVSPFQWHGVVETADFFQTVPVDSSRPQVDPQGEARTFYKPEETDVTRAAKASHFGRVYLDWAVFPYVESEKLDGEVKGYLARLQDLRYDYPGLRARGRLGGFVVLAPNLQVEEQGPDSAMPNWLQQLEEPKSK
jgi:inner membrane protein